MKQERFAGLRRLYENAPELYQRLTAPMTSGGSARGHTALLRAALRHRSQVAYLYAEQPAGSRGTLRIYTDVTPDRGSPEDPLLDW